MGIFREDPNGAGCPIKESAKARYARALRGVAALRSKETSSYSIRSDYQADIV
jgi:hypothetical protein